MANNIEVQFLSNAKAMMGELRSMNAYLHNIQTNLDQMNAKAVAGHQKHGSALKGLALRFVGYNLALNAAMNAQQKVIEYVKESVAKYREFETRIAEVSTIMTGDFEPALQAMKGGIESLALSTGQATSDLTKGLYDIMSAAFNAKDAINLLNTATKASIAGLSDVRTSVDIFTTVLNTYGMSVYEATKVSDALFQSVVRGKFQFQELESALGYVVPIAAQAGIEFEELMAALSTTTRHGLHLDMAARGLAMALQNIINPSEGASKAAEQYGIELSGLALRIKGISGVFGEMHAKTKEYGKVVLNELIPNIRALRVAMVLAGEEGLEGLTDDMERLQVSAGRTEEAFNKIKNTSQFASNVITQDWEKTQREVGKAWDKLSLGIQRGITDIAANWTSFIPALGVAFTMDKWDKHQEKLERVAKLEEKYLGIKKGGKYGAKYTMIPQSEIDTMKSYLDLQEQIANMGERISVRIRKAEDYDDLEEQLLELVTISEQLTDDFNRAFGEPILGGIRNLEELKLTLEEIELDAEKLREHLEKPLQYGWGDMGGVVQGTLNMQMKQLKADQDLADTKYDVKMGLVMENYQFKVLNKEMQNAIKIIREHDAVTKKDTESINLMNIALRNIQIEMMELQLVGMMKRRGLSRQEERRMKQLQIAAAKLRLENMKNTKAETASEHIAYEQAKQMIEEHIAAKEHESYMLKYNYDQQVKDLQTTIDFEAGLLKDRETQWIETTNEIINASGHLVTSLKAILADPELKAQFEEFGFNITEMLETVQSIQSSAGGAVGTPIQDKITSTIYDMSPTMGRIYESLRRNVMGYKRGTEYVHETGLAMLHRGETIGAAGKDVGGGVQIGSVTIQVKELADIGDVEKLAALLSVAKNSQVLTNSGKSRYRVR